MTKLAAGKEVISYCTKCKLNLAHLIMNMKADKKTIGKVQCKTCDSTHAFKDPEEVAKKAVERTAKRDAKKKADHQAKEKKMEEDRITAWNEAMKLAATKKPVKYSMKTKFILGDLIEHPNFGKGIVDALHDDNKINVIFKDNTKLLMHNMK